LWAVKGGLDIRGAGTEEGLRPASRCWDIHRRIYTGLNIHVAAWDWSRVPTLLRPLAERSLSRPVRQQAV